MSLECFHSGGPAPWLISSKFKIESRAKLAIYYLLRQLNSVFVVKKKTILIPAL